MRSILFVCLGNICRSPSAQGLVASRLHAAGLTDMEIDSAGTGDWHIGHPPDPRAISAAQARGVDISALRARQVTPADFERFDLMVAMDRSNHAALSVLQPHKCRARLAMMTDFADGYSGDVADPYFGGSEGFETMLDVIEAASAGLIAAIKTA